MNTHRTLTISLNNVGYEITTFCTVGEYVDHRHLSSVKFNRNIKEDLASRDSPVNAMAADTSGKIRDFYDGQFDLEHKLIRYQTCKNGSHFIYDITETGIGTIVKVKCPACGVEEDITDVNNW